MDIRLQIGLLAYKVWTDAHDISRQAFGLFTFLVAGLLVWMEKEL